jgi:hypothetical protein
LRLCSFRARTSAALQEVFARSARFDLCSEQLPAFRAESMLLVNRVSGPDPNEELPSNSDRTDARIGLVFVDEPQVVAIDVDGKPPTLGSASRDELPS